MEEITKIVLAMNPGQILALGAILWFFYARIDKRFDGIDRRLERVEETVRDIDRRLCRLEGAFNSKECCMLTDRAQTKKAE